MMTQRSGGTPRSARVEVGVRVREEADAEEEGEEAWVDGAVTEVLADFLVFFPFVAEAASALSIKHSERIRKRIKRAERNTTPFISKP